jgi:hypothetical protein
MKGDFGESVANTLIGMWTQNGQLFETKAIGGKWPVIDIYAEAISSNGQRIFCFFQVKLTELGYTKREHKLKVQIHKDDLNKLANYNAPTYLIGVDYDEQNPTSCSAYIKVVRGNYQVGLSSIETTNVLNAANIIILKHEVESYWANLSPLISKSTYQTSF